MLNAIVRHRTDEQPKVIVRYRPNKQPEHSRNVVVLSCDRFRRGRDGTRAAIGKESLTSSPVFALHQKSISKLMYIASRIPIRPEIRGRFL